MTDKTPRTVVDALAYTLRRGNPDSVQLDAADMLEEQQRELADWRKELDDAESKFSDALMHELNKLGIPTDEWDGDDGVIPTLAKCIKSHIESELHYQREGLKMDESRLASHAEREGAEPFCWAVQNDQGYFVGAYTRKDSAEIVKNRGTHGETIVPLYSNPAPSAASGLADHDHEVMFTLRMSCEHDERHQALALRTWLPAIERWYNALRSRPAQGDCLHDFEYFTNAAGTTPFERCRKCGTSRSL